MQSVIQKVSVVSGSVNPTPFKSGKINSIDFKAKMIKMGDVLMYRVILCFVYLRICIRIFCFSRSFFLKDCKKELLFSSLFER